MELFRKRQIDSHYPIIYIDATFINTKRVDSVSKEAYYIVLGVKQSCTPLLRQVLSRIFISFKQPVFG